MANMVSGLFGLLLGRGSSRNDLIIGSERGERFDAKGGNDWINAAGGDDTVVGGKGNDFVAGGLGTDTAVFSGSIRSYSWVTLPFTGAPGPLGFAGNLIRITGPDGTDWLRDIEFLRFSDALVQVGSANAAPVAVADSYQVYEDLTLTVPASGVLANDSDPDNNSLTALLVSGVSHGALNFSGDGSFTYTPNADYFGADSFTYKANDGTVDGNTVTVSIEVTRNTAPSVPSVDGYRVDEDNTLTVNVANGVLADATDADADAITAILVSAPAHGTLNLQPNGSFTYTPNDDFNGEDSFTFKPNDGKVDGNTVTVKIEVAPVNDLPVAVEDSYQVDEDGSLIVSAGDGVLANDSDVENDPLTAGLVTDVSHGTLSLDADGSFTYTPEADFFGEDSFTYTVNDGTDDGNTVTVTITVNPVNDAPVAVEDSYLVDEDGTLTVLVADGVLSNDSDTENDTLTAVLVSGVSHGTLDLDDDGSFTYTPDADYNGEDSFSYTAYDGTDNSNTVTVTLTVDAENDAPVAVADSYEVDEDGTLTVVVADGVLANDSDIDNDNLTVILDGGVAHGTLTLQPNGSFTYEPNADFYGEDSFTYYVSDGADDSGNVTVTITVNPVNDAPIAENDDYNVDEDGLLTVTVSDGVLSNDSDTEGDTLTAVLETDVQNGTLFLEEDGSFTYTPFEDFNGEDSFTYRANDGTDDSDIVTVTITVDPVNDAPVAQQDRYDFASGGVIVSAVNGVLSNDSDIDLDNLTAVLVDTTENGQLTFNSDGSFEYTRNSSGGDTDRFTYQAFDGIAFSEVQVVFLDGLFIPV